MSNDLTNLQRNNFNIHMDINIAKLEKRNQHKKQLVELRELVTSETRSMDSVSVFGDAYNLSMG